MEFDWRVRDLSAEPSAIRVRATIPEVTVEYVEADREQWTEMRGRFTASGMEDWSAWGPYEELARCGRFHFPYRRDDSFYGYAEAYVARLF